ncbi:hypothetical protein [Viridibacillus arvi]|uniref:Uncharacterized protein n=1 Tax=Viridibacillus arvi TaxID=263475 RepID=A0A0M0LDF1_9BACL|nr:hypothetical protein [Viridibacillus arvi]KOO49125.1 hypothetical protein AMD00_12085 [Viridibacillus arvi]
MNDKKKGKLQDSVIVIMILLLVTAFVLFEIFMMIINFISNWTGIKNEEYVYNKSHKNNDKW